MTALPKPSEKLQEKLQDIDSKINSEANSTQDTIFFKSIKKIESSATIKSHLHEIQSFARTKKEIFNDIHQEFIEKSEKLSGLQKTLEDLEAFDVETEKNKQKFEESKNHFNKTENDLTQEYYYNETLKLMLKRSRDLVKIEAYPINRMNQELFKINLEIKKELRDLKQLQFEEKQIKKKFKKMKKEIMTGKAEKTQGMDFVLKIYEDQQRLKKYLELENKRHEMFEKTKKNNERLLEFEKHIARLKKQNILSKEHAKLNRMLEHQERKFRTIQKATNSSKIEDILPYYIYLITNKKNLQQALADSLQKIEELNKEKQSKYEEYNEKLKFIESNWFDLEIQEMKIRCVKDEENLDKKEKELEKLNQLVLSAINTLSRLVFQLSEDLEVSVGISNINYVLGFCCIRIEKLIEAIQSHQSVYYIESVNTDMNYKTSPDFLKLLSSDTKNILE